MITKMNPKNLLYIYISITALERCILSFFYLKNLISDSTYSERFMGTPEQPDNYVGYERSSLLKKAAKFKKKKLLIVHGTADGKLITYFIFPLKFIVGLILKVNVFLNVSIYVLLFQTFCPIHVQIYFILIFEA